MFLLLELSVRKDQDFNQLKKNYRTSKWKAR